MPTKYVRANKDQKIAHALHRQSKRKFNSDEAEIEKIAISIKQEITSIGHTMDYFKQINIFKPISKRMYKEMLFKAKLFPPLKKYGWETIEIGKKGKTIRKMFKMTPSLLERWLKFKRIGVALKGIQIFFQARIT